MLDPFLRRHYCLLLRYQFIFVFFSCLRNGLAIRQLLTSTCLRGYLVLSCVFREQLGVVFCLANAIFQLVRIVLTVDVLLAINESALLLKEGLILIIDLRIVLALSTAHVLSAFVVTYSFIVILALVDPI